MLYIHRHPLDVLSSYRRRGRDDPSATWARDLELREFCALYEQSVRRVIDWLAAGGNNLMPVSYEHFTSEPESSLRDICDWLGEPFEADLVREQAPQPGRWQGDPHLWTEIVPTTKKWEEFVTAAEAAEVQRRLAPLMNALDYRART